MSRPRPTASAHQRHRLSGQPVVLVEQHIVDEPVHPLTDKEAPDHAMRAHVIAEIPRTRAADDPERQFMVVGS